MVWIAVWVLLSLLVATMAADDKRNGLGWFIVSMLLSPLFGFIILKLCGKNPTPSDKNQLELAKEGAIAMLKSPWFWLLVVSVLTGFYLAGKTHGG